MNDLSMLFYLASVLPELSRALGGLLFCYGVMLIIWWVILGIHNGDSPKSQQWPISLAKKASIIFAIALGVLLPLKSFLPSERSLYMIAGSQIGEVVIKDDETREVFLQMKDTLLSQLKAYEHTESKASTKESGK